MQNALNEVWTVPLSERPGFPWNWLRSFGLIATVGGGLIITSVISSLASGTGHVLTGIGANILGLMAWLFLEAEVALYAAEINVVLVRRLWPRALVTPPYTEADREAHLIYARATQRDRAETISIVESPDSSQEGKAVTKP